MFPQLDGLGLFGSMPVVRPSRGAGFFPTGRKTAVTLRSDPDRLLPSEGDALARSWPFATPTGLLGAHAHQAGSTVGSIVGVRPGMRETGRMGRKDAAAKVTCVSAGFGTYIQVHLCIKWPWLANTRMTSIVAHLAKEPSRADPWTREEHAGSRGEAPAGCHATPTYPAWVVVGERCEGCGRSRAEEAGGLRWMGSAAVSGPAS